MVTVRLKLPSSEGRVARWLVAFMTLGFIALAAAAVAIGWITVRNQSYTAEILHTQDVRQAIATLQVEMEQSETARRGYILVGTPLFATAYARTANNIVPSIRTIRRLTSDNPAQTTRIDRIESRFVRLRALRTQSMTLVATGRIAEARRRFAVDASVPLMRGIRYRLQAMAADEVRLLAIRTGHQQRSSALFLSVAGLAAALPHLTRAPASPLNPLLLLRLCRCCAAHPRTATPDFNAPPVASRPVGHAAPRRSSLSTAPSVSHTRMLVHAPWPQRTTAAMPRITQALRTRA